MLKATKSLSAGLRTLVIASAAEAPAEEKPVKDLRRFETLPPTDPSMGVPPSSSEGGVEAELSAAPEEPSALALQTAAYTAELLSHVERLKGRLTALEAINDEGARLQKALQQQEEEDSLKMMRFLRRQEEHYSVELVSKMKFVEEETERRVAREKEEEMDEVRALAGALIAHGGTSLAPSTSLACCQPSPPPVSPPPLQDEPRPSERCSHPPSHSSPVSHPLASAFASASPESPFASPCPPLAFMSFSCLRVPLTQLKARHEADRLKYDEDAAQLQQMAEAAIEEARVEAAVETERRMQAEAVALLQEEHASHGARLRSLSLDVDALYQVRPYPDPDPDPDPDPTTFPTLTLTSTLIRTLDADALPTRCCRTIPRTRRRRIRRIS